MKSEFYTHLRGFFVLFYLFFYLFIVLFMETAIYMVTEKCLLASIEILIFLTA